MSVFASVRSAFLITVPVTEVLFESYYVSCSHVRTMGVEGAVFPCLEHHTRCAAEATLGAALPSPCDRARGTLAGVSTGRPSPGPFLPSSSSKSPAAPGLHAPILWPHSSSPEPAGSVGRGPGGQAEQSTVGTGTRRNRDGSQTGSATRRAGDPGEV